MLVIKTLKQLERTEHLKLFPAIALACQKKPQLLFFLICHAIITGSAAVSQKGRELDTSAHLDYRLRL